MCDAQQIGGGLVWCQLKLMTVGSVFSMTTLHNAAEEYHGAVHTRSFVDTWLYEHGQHEHEEPKQAPTSSTTPGLSAAIRSARAKAALLMPVCTANSALRLTSSMLRSSGDRIPAD